MDIIYERPPLPYLTALRAVARCSASTARLLRQHRLRLPARWVGTQLRFADGTSARVYRETVCDRGATLDPCVLVVEFRLRAVRGLGHAAFRRESLPSRALILHARTLEVLRPLGVTPAGADCCSPSASASGRPGGCSGPAPRRRAGWNLGRSALRFQPLTCSS